MGNYKTLNKSEWRHLLLDKHPIHDTCWSIALGYDGNVYIGACREYSSGGIAQLYCYDPQQDKLEHLADMEHVTGERHDSGYAVQGKIHFSLCPSTDGYIYGATHCTTAPLGDLIWSPYGMWDDPHKKYPGGHIFRRHVESGKTDDFGVVCPNEGIPYLMLDEKRGYLYGITFPKSHFFRTNLQGREFVDFGRISSWYPLSMVFDRYGNIFTSDFNSRLIKYDVEKEQITFSDSFPYSNSWNKSKRCSWIADMCMGPDEKIYGIHYSNDHLFRFDPYADKSEFEDLGSGLGREEGDDLRCLISDKYDNLYYIVRKRTKTFFRDFTHEHIFMKYNIKTGKKTIIGKMEREGKQFHGWRGVCADDGSIYIANTGAIPTGISIYTPKGEN